MSLIKILIAIIVLCILTPSVFAASASVTPNFDASEYYQGKNGAVDVYVTNDGEEYILLEEISINFDWMQTGYAYTLDKTSAPIRIEAGNKVKIGTISFGVESSVSIGYHTYQWAISGQENKQGFWGGYSLEAFSTDWFGSSRIYVEDALKPKAIDVRSVTINTINNALLPESSDAKNKILEAKSHFSSAETYFSSRDFSLAISEYNAAKSYIEQAYVLEADYQKQKEAEKLAKEAEELAKQNAESTISTVKSKISTIIDLRSEQAIDRLKDARTHLNTAENHLATGKFEAAIKEANIASDYSDDALKTEETWRSENPIKSTAKASGFQLILSFLSIISIGYYLRKN